MRRQTFDLKKRINIWKHTVFSPAIDSGLSVGDQILSVDGVSLINMTHINAIRTLKKTKTVVLLRVRRFEEIVEKIVEVKEEIPEKVEEKIPEKLHEEKNEETFKEEVKENLEEKIEENVEEKYQSDEYETNFSEVKKANFA